MIRVWLWDWIRFAWSAARSWFRRTHAEPPTAPVPGHESTACYILRTEFEAHAARMVRTGFLSPLARAAELGAVLDCTIRETAGSRRFEHRVTVEPRTRV